MPSLLHLLAIDLDLELRHVDPVAGEDSRELRRLVGAADQRLRGVVQLRLAEPGAVLQLHLEPADLAQPLDRRRREDRHERVLDAGELPVERPGDGRAVLLLPLPLLERLEREEDDAGVRGVDEPVDREPGELHRVLDARLLEADLRHLPDDALGAIERRGVGQLRERDEVLLVLRRHEAVRHLVEAEHRQRDQPGVHDERDAAPPDDAADRRAVALGAAGEEPVEGTEDPAAGSGRARRVSRSGGASRGLSRIALKRRRQRERVERPRSPSRTRSSARTAGRTAR